LEIVNSGVENLPDVEIHSLGCPWLELCKSNRSLLEKAWISFKLLIMKIGSQNLWSCMIY